MGGRIAGTEEIGIVAGTGRQDELEFQLLDPMADVRIGDALVTFGSKGGRPFAPGLPIIMMDLATGEPDVFGKEPPEPSEPLLKLDNVTLSSHAGYNTPEAAMTMYRRAIDLAAAG